MFQGARSIVVGGGRKALGLIPDEVIEFFNWSNPSGHTMSLGFTQPLTEISTRDFQGDSGKLQPVLMADVTAICEPVVQKM
jgi:hypothetical protein